MRGNGQYKKRIELKSLKLHDQIHFDQLYTAFFTRRVPLNQIYSRRKFIAASAAGVGGLALARFFPAFGEENKGAWVNGMQINPAIDNLRVVNCTDPAMITADPTKWDIVSQNAPVVAERVRKNIDAMACALAQKTTPAEAWAVIFRKPETKQWSEVKVAIKPNASGNCNNTRVAVIGTVCSALIGLGVLPENIAMYGCSRKGLMDTTTEYRPFVGSELPSGIFLSNGHESMGGTVKTRIPKPQAGEFECAAALANGTIDILVNIGTNKGHMFGSVGGVSLTMKNHCGSFLFPVAKHFTRDGIKFIIAINKSNAILGGTPVRQQLCIVDSLWGMKKGPSGVPTMRLNSLSMGTFGPAVDWVVMKKIREPLMGCKHPAFISTIMTEFGYQPSQFENLDIIKVEAV
jgi:hypothetical protein